MSSTRRKPSVVRKPSWDATLVSHRLEGQGATAPTPAPPERPTSDTPPGKLSAPERAPRKSGFYERSDPYAGLDRLDRPELDDDEAVVSA